MTGHESGGITDLLGAPADAVVVRRARQLCLRAEPHAEESPCPAHVAEARRQLLALQG